MKKPHELLPDSPIVDLDTAYEIVARVVLQSPEQARDDFLAHGRGDRLPRLRWYKAVNSWVDDDEELAADFLKRCEPVADGWHLDLAVRGEAKPDGPHTTTEVNGEFFLVLDNDVFGLSRDDLIKLYPVLAPKKRRKAKMRHNMIIAILHSLYPHARSAEDILDSAGITDLEHQVGKAWPEECKRRDREYAPPSWDTIKRALKHFHRP